MARSRYDDPPDPALMRREPLEAFWAAIDERRHERGVRRLYTCAECAQSFEADLKRCPVCRRKRKLQRRQLLHAADRQRGRISKTKRRGIYERDGHRCLACGSEKKLTLDHIVPISKGGTNDESNLQTLCEGCNCRVKRGKLTNYLAAA